MKPLKVHTKYISHYETVDEFHFSDGVIREIFCFRIPKKGPRMMEARYVGLQDGFYSPGRFTPIDAKLYEQCKKIARKTPVKSTYAPMHTISASSFQTTYY